MPAIRCTVRPRVFWGCGDDKEEEEEVRGLSDLEQVAVFFHVTTTLNLLQRDYLFCLCLRRTEHNRWILSGGLL